MYTTPRPQNPSSNPLTSLAHNPLLFFYVVCWMWHRKIFPLYFFTSGWGELPAAPKNAFSNFFYTFPWYSGVSVLFFLFSFTM